MQGSGEISPPLPPDWNDPVSCPDDEQKSHWAFDPDIQAENECLKQHIIRLSQEMLFYQQTQNSFLSTATFDVHHSGYINRQEIELPPWITCSKTMSPLFHAYDMRIEELCSLVEQQGKAQSALNERTRNLLAENEQLLKRHSEEVKKNATITSARDNNDETNDEIQTARAAKRNNNISQENELLTEQIKVLTKEAEHAQETVLSRNESIESLNQSIVDASGTIHNLQKKMAQLISEKRQCENELVKRVNVVNCHQDVLQKMKQEIQLGRSHRANLKARAEELTSEKEELELESEQMTAKVTACTSRFSEMLEKLSAKTIEADDLKEKCHKLARDMEYSKVSLEGTQKRISSMKKEIESLSFKEEAFNRLSQECKTKVEDALLDRDKLNVMCSSLRNEIERLTEGSTHESQEALKNQMKIVDALKSSHVAEVSDMQAALSKIRVENAKLKIKAERSVRDKISVEDKYSNLKHIMEGKGAAMKDNFAELSRRAVDAEVRFESEKDGKQKLMDQVKNLQQQLAGLADSEDAVCVLERKISTREKEIELSNEKCRHFEAEMEKLLLRIEECNNAAQNNVEEILKKHEIEEEELRIKIEKARAMARENEVALQEQTDNRRKAGEMMQYDNKRTVDQIERNIQEEREINHRLMRRNQQLSSTIHTLAAEKDELNTIVHEAEGNIEKLEHDLQKAEACTSDLGRKLSQIIQEQQHRLKETSNLKMDLREAQLEIERIKRVGEKGYTD